MGRFWPARVAHTRHYMPWEKKGPADRTLVFDTFVSIARTHPLFVGWPDVTMTAQDRATLHRLATNLTSLGRAEGWVECDLADGDSVDWNCAPGADSAAGELVSVFCADPATAFGDEHYPVIDKKKLKKGLPAGDHLFDCPRWHLCLDTETIHKERWASVPGATWVGYVRRADAFSASPARDSPGRGRPAPTVARFALDGAVLPLVTETLAVAEAFRSLLLGRFKGVVRRRLQAQGTPLPPDATPKDFPQLRSRILSGKDDGQMIHGSHDHAYYLPTDEDGDGRIDHLTVVAAGGLDADEVAALNGLRQLRLDDATLRLQLVGLGQPDDFRCPLFGPARVWRSATPFVATRHVKTRGQKKDAPSCRGIDGRREFASVVLSEELARWRQRFTVDEPGPAVAEMSHVLVGNGREFRVLEFRRARQKKAGDDGFRRAAGAYRLEFAAPVSGPICLGHAAHFGLGLFLPAEGD